MVCPDNGVSFRAKKKRAIKTREDMEESYIPVVMSSNFKIPDFERLATNSIFKENKTIVQTEKSSCVS